MQDVKFGLKQVNKPMPANITRNLSISAFILSTLSGYMASAAYIPASLSSVLQGLFSVAASICLGLIPFFGVETDQKKVPIEDVAAIETEEKKP